MSTDELSLLAAELTQLADTLAVIAAVQASCPVEKTPQIRSLSRRDSPQRHRPSRLLSHAPELLSACLDRSVQPPTCVPAYRKSGRDKGILSFYEDEWRCARYN